MGVSPLFKLNRNCPENKRGRLKKQDCASGQTGKIYFETQFIIKKTFEPLLQTCLPAKRDRSCFLLFLRHPRWFHAAITQ